MINFQMMIHTYGKSIGDTIRLFIEKRYERWAEYSAYHCTQAGIASESVDILNEVILALLQKEDCKLEMLMNAKKGQYTELDFFVLRMIKLNVYSPTSPYRSRYKPIPSVNIDFQRLNIIDDTDTAEDIPARILKEMRLVSWVAKSLDLPEFERSVFEHYFINNEPLSLWPGPEKYKKVNETYHYVIGIIHSILYLYDFTKVVPKGKLTDKQAEIADRFVRTHRIKKNKQSNINI